MNVYKPGYNYLLLKREKPNWQTGVLKNYEVVGSIQLRFKNRKTVCNAMVLSGDYETLLGVTPLEDMPA